MKGRRQRLVVFLSLLLLSKNVFASVQAGEVLEVPDGEHILVVVQKKRLNIRICSLSTPNRSEPLGELVFEHLATLVKGKQVLVEYLGIDQGGGMVALVNLNGVDIGMQMIRDGAARYKRDETVELPAGLRSLYEESERAARNEARGIWQVSDPSSAIGQKKIAVGEDDDKSQLNARKAEAKKLNDEAYALILDSKHIAALPKARQAVRLDPELAEAHKNIALIFVDIGRPRDAISEAREAIRLKPDLDKSHNVMGKILFALGDFEGSVKEYTEAIRLNPKYTKAYYNLGVTFSQMGLFDRALKAYDQAGKLDPQLADVELNSGWVLYKMGKRAEARTRWLKVMTMNDPRAALQAQTNLSELKK